MAMVISQVFREHAPDTRLGGQATILEALKAGIAGQLAGRTHALDTRCGDQDCLRQ
jgi:hypothetical protein